MSILLTEQDDIRDVSLCKDIGETLHKHYPDHLWAVMVQGGTIVIQNLNISTRMGMRFPISKYYADPGNKEVIRKAGELLERAHMFRGAYDGEQAKILEGAPDKYQPTENLVI